MKKRTSSGTLYDEQIATAHDYDRWFAQDTLGARWVRFWFAPNQTLFLNTPARRLPRLLSLKPTDKLLDIGCGYGGLLIYLHRKVGFSQAMEGLDCSSLMVARAREEFRARGLEACARISHGLATRLPYPDATFDVIVSTYVIKHLSDDLLGDMLAEAMRVLKPGGRLCLWEAAPSRNPYLHNFNVKLLKMGVSSAHLRTVGQLRAILELAGFRDLKPYGHGLYYYYPPLPRVGFIAVRPPV
ncbi:MAG: class I SAM-dependent methyltransferase [Desulfuromonadales bacterium]|nr:class I SAM-dependent methyltransferase [Desulfuromonadales bacterium]